jgi:hypothetical protein
LEPKFENRPLVFTFLPVCELDGAALETLRHAVEQLATSRAADDLYRFRIGHERINIDIR